MFLWSVGAASSGGIAEDLGLRMPVAVEEEGLQYGDGIEVLAFGGVKD